MSKEQNRSDTATTQRTPRSRGGRPSKAEAVKLERHILETAANLFATQGFAATSMEQIASACGAGKDTIYRRYPSKTLLFSALMAGLQTQVLADLEAALRQDDTALDRLQQYARAILSANLRPQLVALNRVALSEPTALGERRPETQDPIMLRLVALVEAAQKDGALAGGDPGFLATQLLYATSIRPLMSRLLGETGFEERAAQEDYFRRAWDLFLNGADGRCRDPA